MLTNPHAGAVKKYFVKIYKNQSNQKSNHALINLLNTLALHSLLAVKVKNKNQEDCPEKGIHLRRLARDAIIMLQGHTSTGASPPPSLSIQRRGRSPVDRSPAEIQA